MMGLEGYLLLLVIGLVIAGVNYFINRDGRKKGRPED